MERLMEMFGGEASVKALLSAPSARSKWDAVLSQMEKAYGFMRCSDEAVMYARMPFITEIN